MQVYLEHRSVRIVQEYIGKQLLLVAEEIAGEVFIFASWFLVFRRERRGSLFTLRSKDQLTFERSTRLSPRRASQNRGNCDNCYDSSDHAMRVKPIFRNDVFPAVSRSELSRLLEARPSSRKNETGIADPPREISTALDPEHVY